ncbi:MAG: hypothetical protein OXT09_07480, partial [Myxococcales bacterium]|nr:hypothetical protein [Myxococcales bacterium]
MTRIPRTRTLALLFAGSLAATSLAAAQPSADKPGRHGKRFDKLDANKDGAVPLEEMKAATRARIAGADSTSDGRVTADEMKAHRKARRAAHADQRHGEGPPGHAGTGGH